LDLRHCLRLGALHRDVLLFGVSPNCVPVAKSPQAYAFTTEISSRVDSDLAGRVLAEMTRTEGGVLHPPLSSSLENVMSKGSPIVPVRIPPELLGEVARCIARRNVWSRNEPWTTSGFVIAAIREKLAKMERSRNCKK
jgi:hypothetical protein